MTKLPVLLHVTADGDECNFSCMFMKEQTRSGIVCSPPTLIGDEPDILHAYDFTGQISRSNLCHKLTGDDE